MYKKESKDYEHYAYADNDKSKLCLWFEWVLSDTHIWCPALDEVVTGYYIEN